MFNQYIEQIMKPNSMFSQTAGAVAALILMVVAAPHSKSAEIPLGLPPDSVLSSYVESGRVPGVVAFAATKDRILHQGAIGKSDLETQQAIKIDALFAIQSMTKPVTSVAVMQLVEQGQIELEASVAKYLPEFAHPEVLEGFDNTGLPRFRAAKRPPTIRELLSNTSGYAYPFYNKDIAGYFKVAEKLSRKSDWSSYPLASEPGTRWEYSPSAAILGLVVETVSGLSLEAYFHRHIFEPLGMRDTFYQVPADKWSRVVRLHQRQPDENVVVTEPKPTPTPPQITEFPGDHGLYSTGPDYLRFVRAFLNNGELDGSRVLKPDTVELMSQNQIGDFRAGEMITVTPESDNDVHLFPGATNKFGLGFLINARPVPGGRAAGSLMWAGGANTYFWIDRKQGVGGVVLTQLLPFADTTVLKMVDDYEKAVYALAR